MIPATIKVGPYRYAVVADKAAMNAACRAAHDNRSGETDYDALKITIDPDLAPDMLADTLLHETMHAIQCAVGIDAKDKIVAHEYIYRTSATLLGVLRENPDLVAFLVRRGE